MTSSDAETPPRSRRHDWVIVAAIMTSFLAYLAYSNGIHNHFDFLYRSGLKTLRFLGV